MLPVSSEEGGDVVQVRSGDTLGKLAKKHGITVADLRQWNGLQGDLIQVGQELQIDQGGTTRPLWEVVLERAQGTGAESIAEAPLGDAPRKAARRPGSRASKSALPEGVYPTDDGRFVNDDGMYVNRQGQPIDEDGNVLGGGVARQWPSLHRPSPKTCLDATTGISEGGDNAFGRSEGLTPQQVSAAVRGFQEQTLRCAEGKDQVTGEIDLEIVVGCDGRVKSVTVNDDGVMEGDFAACVADVMRYAPFPAHARDEVTVQIPLRYD
ncbi:MAG: LysM peptidoglycan-binding domain-containing protein [Deltaproteobacteria bacterium]|nr:LysM peptidoglycan-binding domain-containing protein [Deltaproteobacteria bacterium]